MPYNQEQRAANLLRMLALDKPGLEIAPFYLPTAINGKHNVFYTDYTSTKKSRKKHLNYKHDEIMEIDFIWVPGKSL